MRGVIPMSAMATVLGIHVRVGNEDNLWRVKGERFSSVKQVEQMANLATAYGRKIATCEEARAMMKIGTWYNSPEETLLALGLPPNRKDGEPGFLNWDTSARRAVGERASDSHAMAYCMVGPEAAQEQV